MIVTSKKSAAKYLMVGGRNFREDGWLNLDHWSSYVSKLRPEFVDIDCNLMCESIPLPSKSMSVVYSEHCIEHLNYNAVERFIGEAKRILAPGGVLKICCPDAKKIWDLYHSCPEKLLRPKRKETHEEAFVSWVASPARIGRKELIKLLSGQMETALLILQYSFDCTVEQQEKKCGHHLSWWTFDRLGKIMHDAGFVNIVEVPRNGGSHKVFKQRYLDRTAPHVTLRVEGICQ